MSADSQGERAPTASGSAALLAFCCLSNYMIHKGKLATALTFPGIDVLMRVFEQHFGLDRRRYGLVNRFKHVNCRKANIPCQWVKLRR